MKVLLTGGGTGGHITPILAIAQELKTQNKSNNIIKTIYVGEKGGLFRKLTDESEYIDESYFIRAGKFRRYYGESWFKRAMDVSTNLKNVRDLFFLAVGILQAFWLLIRIKPDIIFLKGGFVGLPVGVAAALLKIPMITHDSDVVPGLANRLIGKWALLNMVAHEPKLYPYNPSKIKQVGVIVNSDYHEVTSKIQNDYKKYLKIPIDSKLLLVTGGSSGAQAINEAISKIALELLELENHLYIIHQVGSGKALVYSGIEHERLKIVDFLKPMYKYTGAADLVVCRGSANTLAELGAQKKPVITIPSPYLAGGHQTKNAQYLASKNAVVVINQPLDIQNLKSTILSVLKDNTTSKMLGLNLNSVTHSNSVSEAAKLIQLYGIGTK